MKLNEADFQSYEKNPPFLKNQKSFFMDSMFGSYIYISLKFNTNKTEKNFSLKARAQLKYTVLNLSNLK